MGVGQSYPKESSEESSTEDEEFIACPNPDYREDSMDYFDITTDAIESRQNSVGEPTDVTAITEDKVAQFEDKLDFFEKVSLVYLLYDEAEIALQYLIQLQQGAPLNVILEWVHFSKKTDNWQRQLLEALCIIQNYEIIAELGYTRTTVDERFLPQNSNSSIFIPILKKQMYRIFENFTNDKAQKFLEYVKRDFTEKQLEFREYGVQYLEMYLLYWITIRYISPTDYSNLSSIFKYIDMINVAESLKPTPPNVSGVASERNMSAHVLPSTSNVFTARFDCNNSNQNFFEVNQVPDKSFMTSSSSIIGEDHVRKRSYEDKKYTINLKSPGICLIINQRNFYREPLPHLQDLLCKTDKPFEERKGTDVDRNSLEKTFKAFGFEVIIKDNLIHSDITEEVRNVVSMVGEHSSLVICILSHGRKGKVYGVNSIPVEVSEIQNIMTKTNTKNLKRKPKLLILQACQGIECQEVFDDGDEEKEEEEEAITTDGPKTAVPRTADMLVFWATVPGYSAVRDKERGTWFIQSLCKAIHANASGMHFEEICTMVQQEVMNKRWETKNKVKAMVPLKESTLSKFFFLPPLKTI